MSVHWIGRVWDFGPKDSSDRLVLLALADCASKDTGVCWPSRETICNMTALSDSSVYRSIGRLEESGYIVVIRKTNSKQGHSYQLLMGKLSPVNLTGDNSSPVNPSPVNVGISPVTMTGLTRQSDWCYKEEPSLNRQEPSDSLETSSSDLILTSEVPSNGNGHYKKNGNDPRHYQFRAMIEAAYLKANGIQCPWSAAEGDQLKKTISACPSLDNPTFKKLLLNYFNSQDHPLGDRPCKFLPRIFSYTSVLTKFKTEETDPNACRFE